MRRAILAGLAVVVTACGVSFALQAAEKPAAKAVTPLAAPDKDGYISLFDGKDLRGWMNASGGQPGAGWIVEEGAMVREKSAGDVWTQHRFGDFVLDLEFKTEGNSGVFIRTDKTRDNVQTGIEIQVDSPAAKPGKHSCGAVYDAQATSKEASKKGEWNRLVVTCKQNLITVEMNGEKIIDMDLDKWSEAGKNPDGTKNKFRTALKDFKREGHIGLQDHGAKVMYRNIRVRPIGKAG